MREEGSGGGKNNSCMNFLVSKRKRAENLCVAESCLLWYTWYYETLKCKFGAGGYVVLKNRGKKLSSLSIKHQFCFFAVLGFTSIYISCNSVVTCEFCYPSFYRWLYTLHSNLQVSFVY